MAGKLLAILVCLLSMTFCSQAGADDGDKRVWWAGVREVEFVPGRTYTVKIEHEDQGLRPMLRIYDGATLVFETRVTPGAHGPMALASLREGRSDLVVLMSAGSANVINTFLIVGAMEDGSFGILADTGIIKGGPTRAKLVELDGKVGLEISPFGLWTRYHIYFIWDRDTKRIIATEPIRVSYVSELPTSDKTIFFNLPEPYKSKVRLYDTDGHDVSEVHLRPGERLLLRRDAATNEEIEIGYLYSTNTIVDIEAIDGNMLIIAKSPGKTKMTLAQYHFVNITGCELRIIVSD